MQPLSITVYVPCFNAAKYLDRVLPALLAQTLPPQEILVIDDGSTDDSVAIAQRYGVRVVRHEQNRGLASARNTAIESAKTELLASVDADVEASPDWLERLAKRLQEDAKIAGVGGKLVETIVSDADRWRDAHMRQSWGDAPLDEARFLYGANNLFRRDALVEVGGYDPIHRTNGEDGYISRLLQDAGYRLAYEPAAVCQHLRQDDFQSISNTAWRWRFAEDQKITAFRAFVRQVKYGRKLRRYLVDDLRQSGWPVARITIGMYFDWVRRDWGSLFARWRRALTGARSH